MPALKRLHQLFVAIELREASTTTGTYQNQTGKMLPIDPTLEFEVARYDRSVNNSHLTQAQGLAGVRIGRARFGLELTGSVGPNQFQDALRCCGFTDENVGRFTIGAVAGGPFRHGETIAQGSSGAFGICVSDTWDGQTKLWVAQDFGFGFGTFDGTGSLLGSDTGATATPSAFTASAGRAWWPYSYRTSIIQFDSSGLLTGVTQGDSLRGLTSRAVASVFKSKGAGVGQQVIIERRHGHFSASEVVENITTSNANIGTTLANGFEIAIRGCTAAVGLVKDLVRERIDWARGNIKIRGTIGEPAIIDFEFLGAERDVVDQGINLHPDTSQILVPPVLLGVNLLIGAADATQSALKGSCIRTFALDMGHDLQIQECMALTANHGPFFGPPHDSFTPRGVDMAMIVGRKPTLTIDPLLTPEADFPWMDTFLSNRTLRMQMTIGTATPNKFYLSMPNLSPKSIGGGETNGLSTRNVVMDLTAGTAPGPQGDNEFVLIQEY